MLSPKALLKRVAEVIILLLAGGYLIHSLAEDWPLIANHLESANWSLLLAAWPLFLLYFLCRAYAWQLIMRSLEAPLPPVAAGRIWFLSEFSRYVPGNIWSFLGRIHLAEKQKVPRKITAVSLIIEIVLLVGSAALFLPLLQGSHLSWLLLFIIPLLVILGSPGSLNWLINRLLRLIKRDPIKISFSRPQLLALLLVFIAGWSAYGLASYLVTIAFVSVGVSWYWLVGGFVIAWLVGYLSFITPMGLGVREGVVVALLTPALGAGLASLTAITSRLWLVVSELSALLIIGLTSLKHQSWLSWWKKHWPEATLTLLILAFIAYFGTFSFLRQANFLTGRFDLGIMDQTVWNTIHGHFFSLIDPNGSYGEVSRFSIHADTMLILLAPLYLIVSSPYVLLTVQVIAVALGALGLYLLGKAVLSNRGLSLLIAFAYLMFAPLQNAVGSEFHAETVTTTCLIFAFYFLYQRRYLPFALFALLCLTGKETMAFMVSMLSIYALLTKRDWRVGAGTIAVSGIWFYLLLWHLMPSSRSDGAAHFALSYYAQLGATPKEILLTLITRPWVWLSDLWRNSQAQYLFYFLLPTALLPLLSPLIFLLALPELMLNMLSNNPAMQSILFQYTGSITPFAFIAMVFGLAKLQKWLTPRLGKRTVPAIAAYCLICVALGTYFWSPLPGMQQANLLPFTTNLPAGPYLDTLSGQLPKTATISATDHLAPHFSERRYIYPFPQAIGDADYLIIKSDDDILGFTTWDAMQQQINALQTDPRYTKIYQNGSVIVYQKVASDS